MILLKYTTVLLNFTSPLHIGMPGIGMEESEIMIHSDTLYSAIMNSYYQLFPVGKPLDIVLTSAFPFVKEKYYFPKPGINPPGFEQDNIREQYAKKVKATDFISKDVFISWISGNNLNFSLIEKDNILLEQYVTSTVRPHVKIDRIDDSSELYYVGETIFRHGAGLYFILQANEDVIPKLQLCMKLLGEQGIGGEKSSGYGRFKAQWSEIELEEFAEGQHFINLSLYYPDSHEELKNALCSYRLTERGGWTNTTGNNFNHKKVFMFSEGSLFKKQVTGTIVDVAPSGAPHPIYRNGYAFMVKAR